MRYSKLSSPLAGLLALTIGLASTAAVGQGTAEMFPDKPVRIIIGFPSGGTADSLARIVAEKMRNEWRQPVVVESKPGAGATIGAAFVASAPPDGYTLLMLSPGTNATSSALYHNLSYDPVKSFAGVARVASTPFIVVVNSSSKIRTMKDLIDLARSQPGQISYSSSGSGAGPHLVTEMVSLAMGVKFLHVPYKGSAPATLALLAGQVEFSLAESSAIPYITSGRMRALAVTNAVSLPALRGLPTIADTVPGFEYAGGLGLVAPAATPREVILKINGTVVRALEDKNVQRSLNILGLDPLPSTPDEYQALLASEVQKYTKLVKTIGLKLE